MRKDWQTQTVDRVILPGATVDPTSMPDKAFRYVDVSSVSNQTFAIESSTEMLGRDAPSRARRQIRAGDVIFATIRPTLKRIAVVPHYLDGAVCSTAFFVFRPRPILDGRFLYYHLFTNEFLITMESLQAGASYPAVNDTQIRAQRISFPTLQQQRRIVTILDGAFQGIDAAVTNAETNLANARELFQSYLSSILKKTKWEEKTVGEIADLTLGKMLDQRKNRGQLKSYLRNSNVRWFEFDLDDLLQMPFEENEHERYTASKGDVLVCEGGYPGRAAIWDNAESIFLQKAIHRVRFKNPQYGKWFVYNIYMADLTGTLRQYFTGTGIQHLTGQSLKKFSLPFPPIEVVQAYVGKLDQLFGYIKDLEFLYLQKLKCLAELKQIILQKAFAGELTARSADALQEAAD